MSDSSGIVQATFFHVALPRRRVHKWAGMAGNIGGYLLLRLTGTDGVVGWGEAPAIRDWGGEFGRYFGESPGTAMEVATSDLLPAMADCNPLDIAEIHRRMDTAIKGHPYAKGMVEMACYDLAARRLAVPVSRLLGGALRARIPVAHSIGLMEIEEAEREAAKVAEEGIRAIKVKIGVDPERDVEIVRRVRAAVGNAVDICVDANQGYRTPGEAIQVFRRIEASRIRYFEQPVEGIDKLAEVQRAIDAPVMADESAWTGHDVLQIAERRAAQIVSIYTTKPGGLYRAMQVAAVARAAGIVCNVNGSVETGIGNLANLHLAAAAEPVVLPCVVPVSVPAEYQDGRIGGIYYSDDLIAEPMRVVDGAIELPVGPGMGIAADEDKIRRYSVAKREWKRP